MIRETNWGGMGGPRAKCNCACRCNTSCNCGYCGEEDVYGTHWASEYGNTLAYNAPYTNSIQATYS
jgi:hypothetical protein